jgi:hypothetical protein
LFSGGLPTRRYDLIRATKKAPTHDEKGRQTVVHLFSFFPKLMALELELAPVIET